MNVALADGQILMSAIESIAWILLVGVTIHTLTKHKSFSSQARQAMLLILAAWAITSLGNTALGTYSYYSIQRQQVIQSQQFSN